MDIIDATAGSVLLRRDFNGVASASAVGRELRLLCAERVLVRIGHGIYSKTRRSTVTGAVITAGSLETLSAEALNRLGIVVGPGAATVAYNDHSSTQLPGQLVAYTGNRRISRLIEVGGRRLRYEHD
nr:DUF6088 family protein [uncultured Albidiferax sp.]